MSQLVLACGGRGRRLALTGHARPKPLVEIDGRPLLDRLLDVLVEWQPGSAPPIVVVPAEPGPIPALVRSRLPDAVVVTQPEPNGIVGAILAAVPHLEGDALVVLGDLVIDGRLPVPQMESPALVIWRGASPSAISKNYGIAVEDGEATKIVEKPGDPTGLICGIGVYLLPRRLIETFRDAPPNPVTGEREITAALEWARARGERFALVEFEGFYCNVNTEEDRAAAERHFQTAARP